MTNLDSAAQPAVPTAPLSPVVARLLARAQRESESGDIEAAKRSMDSALALAPGHPEVLRRAGTMAQDRKDHARAAGLFRQALAVLPDDAELHIKLGVALYWLGEESESLAHLRQACELAPDSANAWYNLAEGLKIHMQAAQAIEAFQRVLAIDHAHTQARLGLARAQISVGRIDAAVAGLREILGRDPGYVDAWTTLSDLKIVAFDARDMLQLGLALAEPVLATDARTRLEFVFARALEDQGNYARSFEVLQRANARQHGRVKWDGAGEHKRVEAMLRVFTQMPAAAPDAELGYAAIFVGSLPRSGSTLVEQILASHPEVEGVNEIKDLGRSIDAETQRRRSHFPLWVPDAAAEDWQRLGEEYLARTTHWHAHKPRFVDKNLLNWMLAGVVLSMLPAARVVIVRRDPLETCLACYRQWFSQGAEFSYDLDALAVFCIDFWRLTRFWLEKYPGRVFDLEYETLLDDQEGTTRRLLDFCGLPFDPACLDFHRTERTVLSAPSAAQVRQPLQRNTARAARYGQLLDGLRQRLRDAGLPIRD